MLIQTHSVYKGSKKEFSLERERDEKMIKRKKMRHTTENSWFFSQVHPNLSFVYTLDLPFYKNQAAKPHQASKMSSKSIKSTWLSDQSWRPFLFDLQTTYKAPNNQLEKKQGKKYQDRYVKEHQKQLHQSHRAEKENYLETHKSMKAAEKGYNFPS